jgi:hypothetical protein
LDLPFRIQTEAGDEPVVAVDGAFDAPGLHLSHWPGNRTPEPLRHELSTGSALLFAELPAEERARLAAGCVAVANNHYDTDGCLAALAVLRPTWALGERQRLLDAAAAGDFFRAPSREAVAVDAALTNLCDPGRSPLQLSGLEDGERYRAATLDALERVPRWLAGGLEQDAALFAPEVAAWEADAGDLEGALFDDLVHLDYAVWTGAHGRASSRAGAPCWDPGRHALFGATLADRVLSLGPGPEGTHARFLLSTASWFDLPDRRPHPRPDLAALAAQLNGEEGTRPEDSVCWRHQRQEGASPELWFGTAQTGLFAEHAADALRPSGLGAERIKHLVTEAVRAAWSFSDDPEDDDGDWYVV